MNPYAGNPTVSASSNYGEAEHCSTLLRPGGYWNAGAHPPQWVEFDLGCIKSISNISLKVEQSPDGVVTHYIKAGQDPNPRQVVATLQGHTTNGETLRANWPALQARYVRIETTQSPSWVAWRDIIIE